MTESIELIVHNSNNLTTPIGVIPLRFSPTVLDELNREGGCGFKLLAGSVPLLDDGTLLEEGKVIRVRVAGQDVNLWEIKKIASVIIGEGEKAAEYLSYSGPSIFEWLSHGIVLPEAGIAAVSDDRAFNYAAKQGSWYVAAQWKNAIANGTVAAGKVRWTAKGWPEKLAATWIWDRVSTTTAPTGDVYFRREFTTSALTDFRLVGTADDYAVVLIDGQQVMAITQFKSHARSFSVDVTLPAGNHVLAVKARNGATSGSSPNPAGFVMAMVIPGDKQTEDLIDSDRFLWTGDDLTKWKVNGYPVKPPGFTIGGILKVLRDEAVGRGVTTLGQIGLGFTELVDSYGVPWADTVDPSFKVGSTLLEVAKQISDTYADVWVDNNLVLHAAPARGVDRSVSVAGNDPVAFRKAQNVTDASVDSTAEISNTLFMKTSTGIKESAGPAASKSKYGRRETFVSAVSSSDEGTAPYIAGQVFQKFAYPRRTPTIGIMGTAAQLPFRDFNVGDWVLAPSDADPNQLTKRRVVSISVSEDSETGDPEYTVEIDTIQVTMEERLARWLQESGNGSKSGGISGTSSVGQSSGDIPPITGSSGDLPLPVPPDWRRPNPPTALQLLSNIVADSRGYMVGQVNFSWTHDGKATDGTTLGISMYNVFYRPSGSGEFQLLTSTTAKSGGYAPLSVLKGDGTAARYEMYVNAQSEIGTTSFASSTVEVVMSKDTTAPIQPQPPTVTCERAVYTVKATDKDNNGAAMAADLAYYKVQTSPTGAVWTDGEKFQSGSFAVIPDLPYGSNRFRLIAYDYAGNASVASTSTTSVSTPLVDEESIKAELEAAKADLDAQMAANAEALAIIDGNVDHVGQALATAEAELAARIDTVSTSADGKSTNYYGPTKPSGGTYSSNDTWYRSPDNAVHRWNGTDWVSIQDTDIADAKQAADDAAAAGAVADGKAVAAKSAADAAAAAAVAAQTKADAAAAAAVVADGKAVTAQNKANTAQAEVDAAELKITAAEGNITTAKADIVKAKADIILASAAASTADEKAVTAQNKANTAQAEVDALEGKVVTVEGNISSLTSSVNGKNTIINAETDPAGSTAGRVDGDRWQRWSTLGPGGKLLASWRYTGTVWRSELMDPVYLPKVDIGDGTFGSLEGDRLKVGSVMADRVIIGGSANALVDPSFQVPEINALRMGLSTGGAAGWTLVPGTTTSLRKYERTTTSNNEIFAYATQSFDAAGRGAAIQVVGGQQWVMSVDVETAISAGVRFNVYRWKSDGTADYTSLSPFNIGVGRRTLTYSYLIPEGITAIAVLLACNTSGVKWGIYGNGVVALKASGVMIEDGAITADKILAKSITAAEIKAGTLTSASGIFGTIDASIINAGTLNADRLNANDIRAKFISVGKIVATELATDSVTADQIKAGSVTAVAILAKSITAAEIKASSLTSASGIFGTMDASVINAGTINAARLDAGDIRAKFLSAGKIVASELVAGTLTSASGVFGTMNASVINSGTINAARLNATDIRAKFLAAGKITAADMVTGTITASSGIIGSLDAAVIVAKSITGDKLAFNTVSAENLLVGDFTNLVPNGLGDLGANVGWADRLILDSTDKPAGVVNAFRSTPGQGTFVTTPLQWSVEPDAEYIFEFWIKADKPNSRLFIELMNEAGAHGTTNVALEPSFTAGVYPLNSSIVPTVWTRYRTVATTNSDTFKLGIGSLYFNHANGAERTATVWIAGLTMKRRSGGELIVDGTITANKLIIGGGSNLLPDPSGAIPENAARIIAQSDADVSDATWWSATEGNIRGWYHNPSAAANIATVDTRLRLTNNSPTSHSYSVGLTPGMTYRISVGAAKSWAGLAKVTPVLQLRRDDGTVTAAAFTALDIGAVTPLTWSWVCPDNVTALDFELVTIKGATATLVRYHSISMVAMTTTSLIVDGSIIADHLSTNSVTSVKVAADAIIAGKIAVDAVTARELKALSVSAGHIAANTITGDKINAGSIRTVILTADAITSTILKADAITSKHTITGAKFQTTAAANRGVQFDSTGLKAWTSTGVQTFSLSASTGDVSARGTFLSGTTSLGVEVDGSVWAGLPGIKFINGVATGLVPTIVSVGASTGTSYAPGTLLILGSEQTTNSTGRTELIIEPNGGGFKLGNIYGPAGNFSYKQEADGAHVMRGKRVNITSDSSMYLEADTMDIRGKARAGQAATDLHVFGGTAQSQIAAGTYTCTYASPAPSGNRNPQITADAGAAVTGVTQNCTPSSFKIAFWGTINSNISFRYDATWM